MLDVTEEYADINKNAHLGRIKRTTWSINTRPLKEKHYASYPLELIETPILASSDVGDVVLDPFMGSGTTALKCIEKNRNYIGFELNNDYYNMCKARIETYKKEMEK